MKPNCRKIYRNWIFRVGLTVKIWTQIKMKASSSACTTWMTSRFHWVIASLAAARQHKENLHLILFLAEWLHLVWKTGTRFKWNFLSPREQREQRLIMFCGVLLNIPRPGSGKGLKSSANPRIWHSNSCYFLLFQQAWWRNPPRKFRCSRTGGAF